VTRPTSLAFLVCAVTSCRTAASSTDASPGEAASEFRGVAVASASSERRSVAGGGSVRHSALLGLKARLEGKVDGGTATYEDLEMLLAVCMGLSDEPCVERVHRVKDQKPEQDWTKLQTGTLSDAAIQEYLTR
jgi:hypothetical protein